MINMILRNTRTLGPQGAMMNLAIKIVESGYLDGIGGRARLSTAMSGGLLVEVNNNEFLIAEREGIYFAIKKVGNRGELWDVSPDLEWLLTTIICSK